MRFPSVLSSWMRGRRVEDRGAGVYPSLRLPPVQPTENIVVELDTTYGVTVCPVCGEKVAVITNRKCRDCGLDIA